MYCEIIFQYKNLNLLFSYNMLKAAFYIKTKQLWVLIVSELEEEKKTEIAVTGVIQALQ